MNINGIVIPLCTLVLVACGGVKDRVSLGHSTQIEEHDGKALLTQRNWETIPDHGTKGWEGRVILSRQGEEKVFTKNPTVYLRFIANTDGALMYRTGSAPKDEWESYSGQEGFVGEKEIFFRLAENIYERTGRTEARIRPCRFDQEDLAEAERCGKRPITRTLAFNN